MRIGALPFSRGGERSGELEIPQCGIVLGVFGSRGGHSAPWSSAIVKEGKKKLQPGRQIKVEAKVESGKLILLSLNLTLSLPPGARFGFED